MSINERIQTIIDIQYGSNKKAFAVAVGISPTVVQNLVGKRLGKPSYDVVEKIYANANISAEWLLTGKGNMLKKEVTDETITPSVSYEPNVGQPYYDVDFLGGFNEIYNSQVTNPEHNIIVPGFDRATLWCNVTGHSMSPKISNGDIIALRPCTIDDIQYGEIYAVVLDTIRTIKIIRKGSSKDLLRYVPINPNFDEQEFEVNRIISVFQVIGSINRFF